MAAATKDDVLKALDRVIDPSNGKSLTEAGLIQGLVLREGHIGFSVEVPASRGRTAEPLRKAAEDAVTALPGVLSVTAVLTAHSEPANARPAPPQGQGHGHPHP